MTIQGHLLCDNTCMLIKNSGLENNKIGIEKVLIDATLHPSTVSYSYIIYNP